MPDAGLNCSVTQINTQYMVRGETEKGAERSQGNSFIFWGSLCFGVAAGFRTNKWSGVVLRPL